METEFKWGGPLLLFTIRHQVQNRKKTSLDSHPVNFYKHIPRILCFTVHVYLYFSYLGLKTI